MGREWILALDGSQRDEPLVILLDLAGELIWSAPAELPNPRLVTAVRDALDHHRNRIGSVVAARGPGSFIGVRSALAAAVGAAQALHCPLKLLGSLEVVAAQADPGREAAVVVADAGRGGTFGQVMTPGPGPTSRPRWLPRDGARLVGRDLPWPSEWAAPGQVIGTPGVGRELPEGSRSLPFARGRPLALAWAATLASALSTGYDRVTADYAEVVGARKWS